VQTRLVCGMCGVPHCAEGLGQTVEGEAEAGETK
jgi:hypothetical protein